MNKIYDATLLDVAEGEITITFLPDFTMVEESQTLKLPIGYGGESWLSNEIGKAGLVEQYANDQGFWRFISYRDQTMRRRPDFDLHTDQGMLLGWYCENQSIFNAPAHLIPGEYGDFVHDETEPLTLRIPQEFISLCDSYGLSAEAVLRGFIADAAEISNFVARPRADGYSSNGSDERMMANDYLDRAYGMFKGEC